MPSPDYFMIGGLLEMNTATNAAVLFFLQLAVILGACAIMRFVMIRIGQAPVIGEMIAGVLLGPSLLGAFAPETSQWLFPPESKPTLYAIASLGLTLYMFIVGMEFRTELFAKRIFTALSISLAGIVAPFLLGIFLAIWLQKEGGFFSASLSTPVASIFIGAALSITAFPMLARIIVENGLSGSLSGTIALAAGSIDDVVAWILLAVVLGAVSGNPMVIALVFVGAILYVAVCLLLIKPLIQFLRARVASEAELFSLMLLLLALGASFTDLVGLYSVFGAFFLGLVIPRDGLVEQFTAKIGPLTSAILLPFFFTYSGLNTRIGLLDSLWLWVVCLVVVVLAIMGKLFACYGAARFSGIPHADSLTIASLMNARGLMELILLNIGLQAGIITPTLFTIMVLMAVATTLMATPLFRLARKLSANNC